MKRLGCLKRLDNKHKGNLAVASAICYFVSAGYTVSIPLTDAAKYDLVAEREGTFQAVAGQTTINLGRESRWSKWEQYLLPGAGEDRSPAEESVGENSSNSAKPLGVVTPSQVLNRDVV